jgi:hypothetical protein
MPLAVKDLVMDVVITNFAEQRCEVLYSGPSHEAFTIDEDHYKKLGTVIRLHLALMGETRPVLSPLSVDVASDREYRVYRYDWVVGIKGLSDWNWKAALRSEALVVQLAIRPQASNIGCTCVAAKLNVLPPSRDTSTWSERNPDTAAEIAKNTVDLAAGVAGVPIVGAATKVAAALSNSLTSRGRWKTNWYVYQYVDHVDQAVEWHIRRSVLDEYGPLLRGSLMLGFHGGVPEAGGIRLRLRPTLAFQRGLRYMRFFGNDLRRVSPMAELEVQEQIELGISPEEALSPSET